MASQTLDIHLGDTWLRGDYELPPEAHSLVLFAHGSGSGRTSSRNQAVAELLRGAGLGTLLFDLLDEREALRDSQSGELRFNIPFLTRRLIDVTQWARERAGSGIGLGYFGASTGAAAALSAAAELDEWIDAVVSRGGRPDLAGAALAEVRAPTLLLVGSLDQTVVRLNRQAYELLRCERALTLIRGASHLFEEPGTLDQAARHAADWFQRHLGAAHRPPGERLAIEQRPRG
jgi:dienelactone hydrolase